MKFHALTVKVILISICLLFLAGGCRVKDHSEGRQDLKLTSEQLVDINRQLVLKDKERTENYISRKGLKMEMTQSGLWFSILNEGVGDYLVDGSIFSLEYTCSLLDGTVCYKSDIDGEWNVVLGKSEIPSGLNEGLRMLKKGGEAIFILPSYLAYGLMGDGNMIPARSVLVYKIKVISDN